MRTKSSLTTLRKIVESNRLFTVPIYQRLYVWGRDQIDTLMQDLWTAFDADQESFYLGSVLVVERQEGARAVYELVDGQQRFTTLWMMSLAWRGALEPFCSATEGRARLRFAIRPEVDRFFAEYESDPDAALQEHPSVVNALALIRRFLADEPVKQARQADFTEYLFSKVQLVMTQVPDDMDLNKLFEVINSRGQQLQHHEILKAQMLARIPQQERHPYALLWEACSDLSRYAEKSLKAVSGIKLGDLIAQSREEGAADATLSDPSKVLRALAESRNPTSGIEPRDLAAILASKEDLKPTGGAQIDDEIVDADDVRSILTFSMLLQHTLRLWLHAGNRSDLLRISDRELLTIFESCFFKYIPNAEPEPVKAFIRLLWTVRYALDRYVIKWIRVGDEEKHQIGKLRLSKENCRYRFVREQPESSDAFTLLQSMLYHSQQITTHYWLTPFLSYIQRHTLPTSHYLAYLRHIDNHLLCTSDDRLLITRSRDFLDDVPGRWHSTTLDASLLEVPLGLAFPHYWFYKLEFLLWDQRPGELAQAHLDRFHMVARNSVEHISPRSPKTYDQDRVSSKKLDTFGNLTLVSRSINSEYGNLAFAEKRARFQSRHAQQLDSLKMALIYQNTTWGDAQVDEHQREMIDLIKGYLKRDFIGETDDADRPG